MPGVLGKPPAEVSLARKTSRFDHAVHLEHLDLTPAAVPGGATICNLGS